MSRSVFKCTEGGCSFTCTTGVGLGNHKRSFHPTEPAPVPSNRFGGYRGFDASLYPGRALNEDEDNVPAAAAPAAALPHHPPVSSAQAERVFHARVCELVAAGNQGQGMSMADADNLCDLLREVATLKLPPETGSLGEE